MPPARLRGAGGVEDAGVRGPPQQVAFAQVALKLTGGAARSALPDAPTVGRRPPQRHRVRRRAAVTLHRLADRLQPA